MSGAIATNSTGIVLELSGPTTGITYLSGYRITICQQ